MSVVLRDLLRRSSIPTRHDITIPTGFSMMILERAQEFRPERTVDGAVIGRQRHGHLVAISILPSRTIGRCSPAPTARIVACGGLITAENS